LAGLPTSVSAAVTELLVEIHGPARGKNVPERIDGKSIVLVSRDPAAGIRNKLKPLPPSVC
jgi:hypothetical protein